MASLTKKVIRGRGYYYLRECQRVDGKPKIVFQRYLGTVDDVLQRLASPDPASPTAAPQAPREADVVSFGAEAALYDLAVELDLVGRIDRRLPKREHSAPSVGTLLLLATLQRAVAPGSKASLAEWHAQSVLRRLVPARSAQLSSQRFWDAMSRVDQHDLAVLEEQIAVEVVRHSGLDARCLLFDCTNFFSFVDSFNLRPTLPQRGHSKEGRASLRIVGLALLCTADFDVPLFHRLYPGNQTDAPTFRAVLGDLVKRCRAIAPSLSDITLVFDKGNNAADNLAAVAEAGLHFVGSLVPTQHRDLLAIPRADLRPVEGFSSVGAVRCTKTVYGTPRTVLVTFNQELYDAQVQTLSREVEKRLHQLLELEQSLSRWRAAPRGGRRPSVEATRREVGRILSGRHMKELIHVEVTAGSDRLPCLTYGPDLDGFAELDRTLLGKNLLFTDRADWTDAQIVAGYRSQHHVESDFRRLKDPDHLAFRPAYHWTDQKLRVHAFTCVLALLLCNLLRKKLAAGGLSLSVHRLLDELAGIREIENLYDAAPGARRPVVTMTMSRMGETQRKLYDLLHLERYRARQGGSRSYG
jgi:transposase